jgi:hypothetical protein
MHGEAEIDKVILVLIKLHNMKEVWRYSFKHS